MRSFILLSTLFIITNGNAQVNRSATELAKENIVEYLTTKIFSGKDYVPTSFQPIKSFKAPFKTKVMWTIGHEFYIAGNSGMANETDRKARYGFLFYLDKNMSVLRAESYEIK